MTVVLEASCAHRNSKLVLRDNTYSTIQWDAFTLPELSNFIQILHREEDIYAEKVRPSQPTKGGLELTGGNKDGVVCVGMGGGGRVRADRECKDGVVCVCVGGGGGGCGSVVIADGCKHTYVTVVLFLCLGLKYLLYFPECSNV